MKHIYRLLASALVLFTAAACYNEEIENPQDPDQQQSDFRITASIIQTRVSYNDKDAGHLDMKWQDGDKLYGFINGETKITFEVSGGTGGIATLVAASGSEEALSSLKGGETVDLVYIGNQTPSYDKDGNIIVSMIGQDPSGKIPACMSARDVVENTDGSKSLDFHFVNDCAIFEIESLTGDISGKALDKIQIPYLFTQGQYTLGENGFVFAGVPNSLDANYKIDVDETKWGITNANNGVVTYNGEEQPLLIAVVPIGSDEAYSEELEDEDGEEYTYTPKITVNAIFSDASNSVFTYGKSTIQGGFCYVISAHPYVARTEDNEYFETVYAAFAHAATLNISNNTVTLLKESITGLGVSEVDDDDNAAIHIDYKVTLDLNGCTLSLADVPNVGPECFVVGEYSEEEDSEGYLTIKDSRCGGTIESVADSHIIKNYGKVTINHGSIKHMMQEEEPGWGSWSVVANYDNGSLLVEGGDLYSEYYNTVQNEGEVTITGGNVHSKNYCAVTNFNALTVKGGTLWSVNSYAISSGGSEDDSCIPSIIIGSDPSLFPKIYSENYCTAILINDKYIDDDEILCSGAKTSIFEMNQGSVYVNSTAMSSNNDYDLCPAAIMFEGKVMGSFTGGSVKSPVSALLILPGAKCTISGGTFINDSNEGTVRCYESNSNNSDQQLIVRWPIVAGVSDRSTGENRKEPFICAKYEYQGTDVKYIYAVPISSAYGAQNKDNYAKVCISGGYLYSKSGFFYSELDEKVGDAYSKILDMESFGDFYSNSTKYIPQDANNGNYTVDLIDSAEDCSGNSDYYAKNIISIDNVSYEMKYLFKSPSSSKASLGTMYYSFSNFGW